MMRHLAHIINIEGRRYPMAVAEISDDCRSCTVMPFSGEIHSTRFHNGEIEIIKSRDGRYAVVAGGCPEGDVSSLRSDHNEGQAGEAMPGPNR